MTKITYIPGEIANAAIDEHGKRKPVTRTHHIFDDAKDKNQAEINADIDNTLALHQSEINALDSGNYVSVDTYSELPSTGSIDTIYRVCNWDGSANGGEGAVDGTVYSQYAWDSTNSEYKLLCVRTQIGEVFDISLWNAVGGVLATYDDLADALGVNGANVPAGIRKGGMSVKFVHTSDNNYTQFRCKTQTFSTDPEDWYFEGDDTLVDNPEFMVAWTDGVGHLLFWLRAEDGGIDWAVGVPQPVKDYVDTNVASILNGNEGTAIDGLNKVIAFLNDFSTSDTLAALLDTKVDKVEGKGLSTNDFTDDEKEVVDMNELVENPEYMKVELDEEEKILGGRKSDGTKVEYVGFETTSLKTDSLNLTKEGMTAFQQALKESGFKPGGGGDFSDRDVIELPEPKGYALLNLIVDSLPVEDTDISEGYAEYYDKSGNYFKLTCELASQGQSSKVFARTGGKGNYTLDLPKDIKFGSWVPQDSFHLKGCAKDVTRSILATSYKWAYLFMEHLNAKPNRVLMDESAITLTQATGDRMTDWPSDARCLPDGFPVEVYINGEYWGLYSWQLKKHRKNYSMDKKDYTSFFIDADAIMTSDYQHGIWNEGPGDWWTLFEIRNPKDLVCMDGTAYDGDDPKELIDDTAVGIYDPDNKAHKGSQTTKNLIKSFQTRYLEVKALIDNNSIVEAKAKFNENFDYNSCMLVYLFNCLMRNNDSVMKNTLWGMYKSGKIFAALWDLDGMYGQGWIGNSAAVPSTSTWDTYANAEWPLGLMWSLYETEIKAAYAEMRGNGIISVDAWKGIVFGWNKRVGQEAYERDIKKWPETPSYRENYTNTDYWTEVGMRSGTDDYPVWDDSTTYAANDNVVIKVHPSSNYYMRYKAVQANTNVCPVTQFYEGFPQVGGFYDSIKRWEKWMEEQISLCDVKMGYSE